MGVGAFVESGETRVDTVAENVHCSVSDSASNIVNGWNMFDGHECNDHLLALTVLAFLQTAGVQEVFRKLRAPFLICSERQADPFFRLSKNRLRWVYVPRLFRKSKMPKKVNLGDHSTWASTAFEQPASNQKKPASNQKKPPVLPPPETQKQTQNRKIISLPAMSTGYELPAFNHAKDNPAFRPRQSWDVGREKYVVKYPPGYDPVTRTFSRPSEEQKPAEKKVRTVQRYHTCHQTIPARSSNDAGP
ncbi:hypothetical protein CYMTET_3579 [Cymbomonas tetramitiformis]|uniref:Uncharacterized protein n=1 Tax=Cymbomonas tetramitiformis TaxID=36881 RepID=A0AAE0H2Z3_9CHLO|nr:hypothetical protein CYMTET_3579 [Cymbomonas tetramitiformis]